MYNIGTNFWRNEPNSSDSSKVDGANPFAADVRLEREYPRSKEPFGSRAGGIGRRSSERARLFGCLALLKPGARSDGSRAANVRRFRPSQAAR
jgi:hypothetical protein